jgi:hypothetical protein
MNDKTKEINVRIMTTAGNYPEHGHEKVPVGEPVAAILQRAATALGIVDTSNWVAKIEGTIISASATYEALGLKGEVKIDYGMNEGAGGCIPS